MKHLVFRLFITLILTTRFCTVTLAWYDHTLLSYPVLSTLKDLQSKDPVEVKNLATFLLEQEKELEKLLDDYEVWAKNNLIYYAHRPEGLRFRATGNADDIVERFLQAIRMNPNMKMQLYLYLMPNDNEEAGEMETLPVQNLTVLTDVSSMMHARYVRLNEGDMVSPLRVLCTANDEPDYGFDLGLFEDNNTPFGVNYGFGVQPFGDPNLEYGSQAPFHMGFYHEPKIVFFFGPFLKKTMPEFRISLCKVLSEFAFASGNSYWGYRFMGWGMHYLGDLSMPYHAAPLPGVSALKMIWTNIKAILGFPKSKDNAVQLVSNRHSVLEQFQWQQLREAYAGDYGNHPMIRALQNPVDFVEYSNSFPVKVVTKESVAKAKRVDRCLKQWMPHKLVSIPEFETHASTELLEVVELTRREKGEKTVEDMTLLLSELFRSYSMHIQSFYKAIMGRDEPIAQTMP